MSTLYTIRNHKGEHYQTHVSLYLHLELGRVALLSEHLQPLASLRVELPHGVVVPMRGTYQLAEPSLRVTRQREHGRVRVVRPGALECHLDTGD